METMEKIFWVLVCEVNIVLQVSSWWSGFPSLIFFYQYPWKHAFLLICSVGQDSVLRSFSTLHDSENKSLGRASFNKAETKRSGLQKDRHMMPPITAFAAGKNQEPPFGIYWWLLLFCNIFIPPANEVAGVYSDPYVHPFVHPSVHPSLPISNPLLL